MIGRSGSTSIYLMMIAFLLSHYSSMARAQHVWQTVNQELPLVAIFPLSDDTRYGLTTSTPLGINDAVDTVSFWFGRSFDGGVTWSQKLIWHGQFYDPGANWKLRSVMLHFFDAAHGVEATSFWDKWGSDGNGARIDFFRTDDSGTTWRWFKRDTISPQSIIGYGKEFATITESGLPGGPNYYLRSFDKGGTWQSDSVVSLNCAKDSITISDLHHIWESFDAVFSDSQRGYCLAQTQIILATTNAGKLWTGEVRDLNPLFFAHDSVLFRINEHYEVDSGGTKYSSIGGYFRSSDFGRTWDTVRGLEPTDSLCKSLTFLSFHGGTGYVIENSFVWPYGDNPQMTNYYFTTDDGMTWTLDPATRREDSSGYSQIAAVSPQVSYMLKGTVLKRTIPSRNSVTTTAAPMQSMAVYPNPASDFISIEPANGTVAIHDMLGRAVECPASRNATSIRFDLRWFLDGIYCASSSAGTVRFVVRH